MKIPLSFIIKSKVFIFLLIGLNCYAQIPGEWLSPVRISNLNNSTAADQPQTTVAQTGKKAITVWRQDSGGFTRIYGSQFNGTNWTEFESPISGIPYNGPASIPQISYLDSNGEAIAVWRSLVAVGLHRVYGTYFNGSTWSPFADPISGTTHTGDLETPRVSSIDQNGNAIAVWSQDDGTGIFRIYGAHFDGLTWSLFADPISGTSHTGDTRRPGISFDGNGKGFAVWEQRDGAVGRIYSAHFNGSAWSLFADPISGTSHTGNAERPRRGIDATGKAIAVWQQLDGATIRIYSARFNGSTWSLFADPISGISHTGHARRPRLTVNDAGIALAVWDQYQGATGRVYGALFNGSSWSLFPDPLSSPISAFRALRGRVVINKNNNTGIAIWRRDDEGGVIRLYGGFYDGTDWTKFDAPISGTTHTGNVTAPRFCRMDNEGNTAAAWQQVTPIADDTNQVYAAFFQFFSAQISGFQISQRYPTQTDLINVIQWTEATSANPIVQYNIYCDGQLLESVSSQKPLQLCHHNRCENQKLMYWVTAVDSEGNEGSASNIITIG